MRKRTWQPPPGTQPVDELLTVLATALFVVRDRQRREKELAAWRKERAHRRLRRRGW